MTTTSIRKSINIDGITYCVVCRSQENLTGHHVVPRAYRRFIPAEYQSHKDVVPICQECHITYELFVDKFKAELHQRYVKIVQEHHKLALANLTTIAKQHDYNVSRFYDRCRSLFEGTDERCYLIEQLLAKGTDELDSFCFLFREHFMRIMQPRYLPQFWWSQCPKIK